MFSKELYLVPNYLAEALCMFFYWYEYFQNVNNNDQTENEISLPTIQINFSHMQSELSNE